MYRVYAGGGGALVGVWDVSDPPASYVGRPYSASQLELADVREGKHGCLRRWYRQYRDGLRLAAGDAAAAGGALHKILEGWLRDGISPDPAEVFIGPENGKLYETGALSLEMVPFLPRPLTAEVEFDFTYEVDGIPFTGRIDAQSQNVTFDHKSTSKKKYAKTTGKLVDDLQATVYARRPDAPAHLQWTTGVWDDLSVVVATADTAELATKFPDRILPIVARIHDVPDPSPGDIEAWLSMPPAPGLDNVPKRGSACGMFPPNGCPWLSECLAHRDRNLAIQVKPVSDLMSKIKRDKAARVEAEPKPQEAGEPAPLEDRWSLSDPTTPIGTLYVDCIPMETPYAAASRFLVAAAQAVCDENGLHHARLMDFAKGGPAIAAQLVAGVKKHVEASGRIEHLVLEMNMAEGREVLLALTGLAERVVRKI